MVPTASAPIGPIIGVPVSPTIDGYDFVSNHTIVSLTPTLAWSAPTLGKATEYYVQIYFISGPGLDGLWTFVTNGTSFVVPPGVLQPGNTYAFYIEAISDASLKANTAPFRIGTVHGDAGVMSGAITAAASGSRRRARPANSKSKHTRIKLGLSEEFAVQQ